MEKFFDYYSSLRADDKWCQGSNEHGLSFFDNRASYSSSLGTLTILTAAFEGELGSFPVMQHLDLGGLFL